MLFLKSHNIAKNISKVAIFLSLLLSCSYAAQAENTLTIEKNRVYVKVVIDGVKTPALLDSGAEMTVLDKVFAQELGLLTAEKGAIAKGTGKDEVKVQFAQNINIDVAGISLTDQTVAIIDLTDVSKRLIGRRLNMILGRNIFDASPVHLDFEKQKITPYKEVTEPSGMKFSLKDNHGIKQFQVSIEGQPPVYADFDLGNGSNVLLGSHYAASINLNTAERIIGKNTGGGLGGEVIRDQVIIRTLSLGEYSVCQVTADIDATEDPSPANIGFSVLRHFNMTVDFTNNLLWLSPNTTAKLC